MVQEVIKTPKRKEAIDIFLKKYPNQEIYNVTRQHTVNAPNNQKSWRVTGNVRMNKKLINIMSKQGLSVREAVKYNKLYNEDGSEIYGTYKKPIFNVEQTKIIEDGDTLTITNKDDNETFQISKSKTGELIIFYETQEGLKRLIQKVGESNLLTETNTTFLDARKSLNTTSKAVSRRNQTNMTKPVSVRQHTRKNTTGVRKHTRNKAKRY